MTRRIEELIDALGEARETADDAGAALLARGEAVLPRLLAAWKDSSTAVRRRLAFLLGKIASRRPHPGRQRALLEALTDADRKVRRNAAVSLGRLDDPSLVSPLRDALARETDPAVKASLTLAFGRFAAPSERAWLESLQPASEPERRALHTVTTRLDARERAAPTVDAGLAISRDARPELWSRRGLAAVVAAESRERGLHTRALGEDRVAVAGTPAFGALLTVRTALHPVLVCDLSIAAARIPSRPAGCSRAARSRAR